jgi:hypothetical protein
VYSSSNFLSVVPSVLWGWLISRHSRESIRSIWLTQPR